jgi:hypothetical protein
MLPMQDTWGDCMQWKQKLHKWFGTAVYRRGLRLSVVAGVMQDRQYFREKPEDQK